MTLQKLAYDVISLAYNRTSILNFIRLNTDKRKRAVTPVLQRKIVLTIRHFN